MGQRAILDDLKARKDEFLNSIAENEKLLRDNPDYKYKQMVLDEIEYEEKIDSLISKMDKRQNGKLA